MRKINLALLGLLLMTVMVSGCAFNETTSANRIESREKITVFKSPDCGCCVGWIAEMERNGYDVEAVETTDLSTIKAKYNIPVNMESCHTAVVGDYFIEGHVPVEAVNKLLEEKPDIDGIALPRMPAGSPGMPGVKMAPFQIYALSNSQISDFMAI